MGKLHIGRVKRNTKNPGGTSMTALQQIFQGYYEHRIESDEPDPERMAVTYKKVISVLNELQIGNGGIDDIMLWVSRYGAAAEETGFYAGFKMAWELWASMQEVVE